MFNPGLRRRIPSPHDPGRLSSTSPRLADHVAGLAYLDRLLPVLSNDPVALMQRVMLARAFLELA